MKVYLAGPINGCTDDEANGWRQQAIGLAPSIEFFDPMVRDYRGKEDQNFREIVEGDKADIDQCDAMLVYFERPSVGTSMEVLWAWLQEIPVIVIDKSGKPLSPWLRYHSAETVQTVEQAVELLLSVGQEAD